MEKLIRVGYSYDFWITDPEPLLEFFRPIIEVFRKEGFQEKDACVCDGVHERETGDESFYAAYSSFSEMDQNLIADFSEARKALDGFWMNSLNFGRMEIALEKDGTKVIIYYSRGRLSIEGDIDAQLMEKADALIEEYRSARKEAEEKAKAVKEQSKPAPVPTETHPVIINPDEQKSISTETAEPNPKSKKSFWQKLFGR